MGITERFRAWWEEYPKRAQLVLGLAGTGLLAAVAPSVAGGESWWGLFQSLGTEFVGAVVIYMLIEQGVDRKEEEQRERNREAAERKARVAGLVAQMRGGGENSAREAVEKLCEIGALEDDSLRGANLRGAHLEKARLSQARLARVNLYGSDSKWAEFWAADLRGAVLEFSRLEGANLCEADLRGASLLGAHMHGAYLIGSHLDGANLTAAHLGGACLLQATLTNAYVGGSVNDRPIMNEATILPNGEAWSEGCSLAEFGVTMDWQVWQQVKEGILAEVDNRDSRPY